MKQAEAASSSGGRLPLVVGGLVGVGVGIAALTFLFWRHTRPGYDDYYPYDDELDDAAADPDSLPVSAVSDGEPIGAGVPVGAAVGAAAGASGLTRSAYPPDDQATVVVKPLSELQEAKSTNGLGSSSSSSDLPATELAKGAGEGGGAAVVGAAALGGAALAAKDRDDEQASKNGSSSGEGSTDVTDKADVTDIDDKIELKDGIDVGANGAEVSRFVPRTADGEDGELTPVHTVSADSAADRQPSVIAFADLDDDDDAPRQIGADHATDAGDDARHDATAEPDSEPVPIIHRIDDLQYEHSALVGPDTAEEPAVALDDDRDDEFLDDDEVDLLYTGEQPVLEDDHDAYAEHDEYEDEYEDVYSEEHEVVARPVVAPGPSAVTILGPMRPGKRAEDDDDHGLLEPDPLEIVTLEDIEQARSTSRSGNRRG